VKHLARVLDDDRVNPLIENSSYFLKACKMGHCDIVRMFLERYYPPFHTISLYPDNDGSDSGDNHISSGDSAVSSPSSSMATTTATAAAKTFKYVLDPTIRRNKSIRLAAEHGHYKVVRLLIDYCQEIDPSDVCQQAFYYAIKNDHPKVVRELLKHPSIDPNDFVSNVNTKSVSPFMLASYLNNSEIMRILLKDSRLPAVSILRDLPRLFRHDNLSILKCILHHYDGKISTYIVCRKLQDYCDSAGNSPPEKICTYLNFTVRLSTQPNALL
jgi:ankyrin repeat protein